MENIRLLLLLLLFFTFQAGCWLSMSSGFRSFCCQAGHCLSVVKRVTGIPLSSGLWTFHCQAGFGLFLLSSGFLPFSCQEGSGHSVVKRDARFVVFKRVTDFLLSSGLLTFRCQAVADFPLSSGLPDFDNFSWDVSWTMWNSGLPWVAVWRLSVVWFPVPGSYP
jgi:hypothetical protein